MMKREQGRTAEAAGFLLLLVTSTVTPRAQAQAQDLAARGKAVVTEMSAGQFDKAESRYDNAMAKNYPPGRLAKVWDNVISQSGAFQAIIGASVKEVAGYRWTFVSSEFEKVTWDFEIAFDSADRVAGLQVKPSREWNPPFYANPGAFHERQVVIKSGDWELPGTLSIPNGPGRFPAVALVQGAGSEDADLTVGPNKPFKDIAWGLASRNVAVLRYVKRTVKYAGQIDESKPGFTVRDQIVDDARAAVSSLAAAREIDPRRIYVLGHGLAGMVAPRIAKGDKKVAGIIVMGGNGVPYEQGIMRQVKHLANVEADEVEGAEFQVKTAEEMVRKVESPTLTASTTVKVLGVPTPGSYWLDLRNYHPAESAAQLKIPVLVLQGGRDYQVTMEDFESWKKGLAGSPRASFKLYPDLFHLFLPSLARGTGPGLPTDYQTSSHVPEIVLSDLADWICMKAK